MAKYLSCRVNVRVQALPQEAFTKSWIHPEEAIPINAKTIYFPPTYLQALKKYFTRKGKVVDATVEKLGTIILRLSLIHI